MDFSSYWNVLWTVIYCLIAILITAGNLTIIVIFVKRKLLERARFLILSLAIADTLEGTVSVPLYIVVGIYLQEKFLVLLFQCVDIFTGVVSIFTLASISPERMYAILWSLCHRTLTFRFYICVIVMPWVFGLLGISSRLLFQFRIIFQFAFSIITNTFLFVPLLVTSIAYILIWRKQHRRPPSEILGGDQDKRLAKTLFIIAGVFHLTWVPHQVISIVIIFCVSCRSWPHLVFHVMKMTQFINSFVNFAVYSLRISDYREAFYS